MRKIGGTKRFEEINYPYCGVGMDRGRVGTPIPQQNWESCLLPMTNDQ